MLITPFQPVGPYFHVMLRREPPATASLVSGDTAGTRIVLEGTVIDGARKAVPDALVEMWQADAGGRYRHRADSQCDHADAAFAGYGRVATDGEGRFRFETIRPGAVKGPGGRLQAPHVLLAVLAPGIITRYWTRAYFDDEPANAVDGVLQLVPPERRETLIARSLSAQNYRFDLVLQGEGETVFFEA
jgi:protocatechuate 3,4-dioxygenase alpha subunit